MSALMECVPNFSEGRDPEVIRRIAGRIAAVEGVLLLDVDPGRAANRTVMTFAGPPAAVAEAAFAAIAEAAVLIDMRLHSGEHPRIGATDVCPLVPLSGISMSEAAALARSLSERVGRELQIPVYCYECASFSEERRRLAFCRKGEYEGLAERLRDPRWKPDFGPARFNARSGATVIGARNLLVAYNVNLDTADPSLARAIAAEVREKPSPVAGPSAGGETGGTSLFAGSGLKACRAIGWHIREYGIAQVSLNLTDLSVTPLHAAFEEVSRQAEARGLRVTGSEIVGLVPERALIEAGKHFLAREGRSGEVPPGDLIRKAVSSLGLDALRPFVPEERILEHRMAALRGLPPIDFREAFSRVMEKPGPTGTASKRVVPH